MPVVDCVWWCALKTRHIPTHELIRQIQELNLKSARQSSQNKAVHHSISSLQRRFRAPTDRPLRQRANILQAYNITLIWACIFLRMWLLNYCLIQALNPYPIPPHRLLMKLTLVPLQSTKSRSSLYLSSSEKYRLSNLFSHGSQSSPTIKHSLFSRRNFQPCELRPRESPRSFYIIAFLSEKARYGS